MSIIGLLKHECSTVKMSEESSSSVEEDDYGVAEDKPVTVENVSCLIQDLDIVRNHDFYKAHLAGDTSIALMLIFFDVGQVLKSGDSIIPNAGSLHAGQTIEVLHSTSPEDMQGVHHVEAIGKVVVAL